MQPLQILVIGASEETRTLLRRALTAATRPPPVSVVYADQLPRAGLDRFAAILIDVRLPSAIRRAEVAIPRARLIANLHECDACQLWRAIQSSSQLLAVDRTVTESELRDKIAEMTICRPILLSWGRHLKDICSPEQVELVSSFLRRGFLHRPSQVARDLHLSPRTLRRRCAEMGLRPPQALLRTAKVAQGLCFSAREAGSLEQAVRVAGYRDSAAFRRAVRRTFGDTASSVVVRWSDDDLEADIRQAILRR